MKKTFLTIALITMLLGPVMSAGAIDSGSKSAWLSAKQATKSAEVTHKQAKLDYASDKTPENQQAVVDTGKELLQKALNEVEEWLLWKNTEAQEDYRVPDSIKSTIQSDVEKNLTKIDGFREEVNDVSNQLELGVVFLKMIGGYLELLVDVARNTGAMWVHIGNTLLDEARDYEAKLRDAADKIDDNSAIIAKLDLAKQELNTAQSNVDSAEASYKLVKSPGQPLLKFGEGNNYLRNAKLNLLNAQGQLAQAFALINAK